MLVSDRHISINLFRVCCLAEQCRILVLHLVRRKEVVGSHLGSASQHARLLRLIGRCRGCPTLSSTLELEEIVDLLPVLLVLVLHAALLVVLGVSHFAVA